MILHGVLINEFIRQLNDKKQNTDTPPPPEPSESIVITRGELERRKDFVEEIMISLGCEPVDIKLPYENKVTSIGGDYTVKCVSERRVYKFTGGSYGGGYYRVDEVIFSKPFIVLEYSRDLDGVLKNIMEDCDPFPYDLPDEEVEMEVKYTLGLEKPPN